MPGLKVSVITPSFNQARFLPETLASIRAQDYPDIENIVVDGGSTDGSVDILRATPGIRWISERDKGQVDALNKGFAMATGEIVTWINSDDTISPHAVRIAVDALERTGADVVYGDVRIIAPDSAHIRMFYGIPFDYPVFLYGINYIGQQSAYFRRSLLQKAGPLRLEYDNAFDYELWLRMALHGRFVYVPELRGQIRVHPNAKSIALAKRTWADTDRIRVEYWSKGGLPSFLSKRPFVRFVNWYYRYKRLRQIRKDSRTRVTPRVLMLGYSPPPDGPAEMYQALLRSSFAERFDVTFVSLNVVRDRSGFGPLVRQIASEFYHLISQQFDFVFYPLSLNRGAILKGTPFLAMARAFGVPIVLYGHDDGLAEFREKSSGWLRRRIDRTIRGAEAVIVPDENRRRDFLGHLREDQVLAVPAGTVKDHGQRLAAVFDELLSRRNKGGARPAKT
ncbi:MAG TPA: glycosyltransferase family 2 protein [Verrucomicrobiae bacterium]|nr:glycosyltransferase family 2 protein [Verrucomicrobiae bacterium]